MKAERFTEKAQEALGAAQQHALRRGHQKVDVEHLALAFLIRAGYEPAYGARPLKRVIQREVETELGRALLSGKARDGQKVLIDYDSGTEALRITPQEESRRRAPARP